MATIVMLVLAACGAGTQSAEDAGVHDAGPDAPADAACFDNPQTHLEIINACTPAQKIYKDTRPPLTNSDGSLPPLPP